MSGTDDALLAQWRDLATAQLRGKPLAGLSTRTYEGLSVEPLYGEGPTPAGLPGEAPFVRGASSDTGWTSWRAVTLRNRDSAAFQVEEASQNGAAVLLEGDMESFDRETWERVCAAHVSGQPLALDFGAHTGAIASLAWGHSKLTCPIELRLDPLGVLARRGKLVGTLSAHFDAMSEWLRWSAEGQPGAQIIGIDTTPYSDAGASDAQELGLAIATAVDVLRHLEARGASIEAAMESMTFTLNVDAQTLSQVAKLRALRALWSRVTAAIDEPLPARIHARPALRGWTRYDPETNILRNTAVTFAAAVGGAQGIITEPHDILRDASHADSRRLSDNVQNILRDESHLGRVLDPAGGAYFFETHTEALVDKAWEVFLGIERDGGQAEALASGTVAASLQATQHARLEDVATRRSPLTGVSTYPNLGEPLLAENTQTVAAETPCEDDSVLSHGESVSAWFALAASASLKSLQRAITPGQAHQAEPLPALRLSAAYEAFRLRSDARVQAGKGRPKIRLVTLGLEAEYTARAMFARNLLEAGGFELTESDEGHVATVVCGPDKTYTSEALAAYGGAYLVGAPGSDAKPGIAGFLYRGCDVPSLLAAIWKGASS